MHEKIAAIAGGALTSLAGIICLAWWFTYDPVKEFAAHVPGMDGRPPGLVSQAASVRIGEYFESFTIEPQPLAGSWPRFRGTDFDNISKEPLVLPGSWDENSLPVLWKIKLGEGHAGPVVLNSRVYVLDYDEERKMDMLRCFALSDGVELWRRGYRIATKRNHGISRSVPAVTEQDVVTIGPQCQVMCADALTGELKWGIDMVKAYGTQIPQWYTAQCPYIDGNTVVLAPAGSALLIGVDLESGAVLWQTPNPKGWQMSHASIMPMTLAGRRMYVYTALGGVAGISADIDDKGTVLWENSEWNNSVVAPSPVIFPDGRIFLTAGYGAGSLLLKVSWSNGKFETGVVYRHSPKEGLASEQQTPILFGGLLYGILPKDGGTNRTQFICYDPVGKLIWASGKTTTFGLGPYLLVDNMLLIVDDAGELVMVKAQSGGYEELGRKKILSGVDAWGPLALAGNRLLLRDSRELVCVQLTEP